MGETPSKPPLDCRRVAGEEGDDDMVDLATGVILQFETVGWSLRATGEA